MSALTLGLMFPASAAQAIQGSGIALALEAADAAGIRTVNREP